MILSRYTINNINAGAVLLPDESLFELPEKVLQFGSGPLLRSLPDNWIDQANRQGIFNGRIVVVEGSSKEAAAFEKQDCLYTVHQSGAVPFTINAAISRVLLATEEWQQVLEGAHNPEIKLILSHTAGEAIQLKNDDVRLHPPRTFPGQLLSFLQERFRAFGGSVQSGLVIIPAEDVPDNGKRLETAVFELAHLNGLEDGFIEWLESCNRFCSSIFTGVGVDGAVNRAHDLLKAAAGYADPLLVEAEEKATWIIEGDETIKKVVSFASAGGIRFSSDASPQTMVNLQVP